MTKPRVTKPRVTTREREIIASLVKVVESITYRDSRDPNRYFMSCTEDVDVRDYLMPALADAKRYLNAHPTASDTKYHKV